MLRVCDASSSVSQQRRGPVTKTPACREGCVLAAMTNLSMVRAETSLSPPRDFGGRVLSANRCFQVSVKSRNPPRVLDRFMPPLLATLIREGCLVLGGGKSYTIG